MGIVALYYSYDGMRSLSGAPLTSKLSIANMGFSEPVCSTVNFGVNRNVITCPYGTIQKIHSFGIHQKGDSKNFTLEEDDTEFLDIFKPRNKGVRCENKPNDVCNRFVDMYTANKTIHSLCLGKDACNIQNFTQFFLKEVHLQ